MELRTEVTLWILFIVILHFVVLLLVAKKPRKSLKGRNVIVTGGSAGIGLHIAIDCAREGANVVIIARSKPTLEKATEVIRLNRQNDNQKISYRSLDLGKKYADVETTLKSIEEELGEIYMLVNCAGMAICGTVDEMSVEDAQTMMNVNYFATYYPTRYVLGRMKKRREGIIVITASQVALFGIYGYGPYAAAKFALRGLAETISMEAKHLNVSVTLALPADTNTPGYEQEEKTKPIETKLISNSGGLVEPDVVAAKILQDALTGSFFSTYGFESWIAAVMCVGMSPWSNPLLAVLQVLLVGPLRAVGLGLQWNFQRIIKNCAKEKTE